MTRYVFRDGCFRDPKTNAPMPIPKRKGVCKPMFVVPDIEPYQSIVENGRVISGRAARREEIARQADKGFVPWEPINDRPRGLINEEFCKRGGLKTSEAAKEWAKNKFTKQAKSAAAIKAPE